MDVGYRLYREVRDFAPAGWTPAERAVAWVIADDARETTRISVIPLPLLCHRTGLSPTGVRAALQKLRDRGYEFRIPRGKGGDGRVIYARRGQEVNYQVPFIAEIGAASITRPGGSRASPGPVDNPTLGDSLVSPEP